MKRLLTIFLLAFTSQLFSQTYGLLPATENELYNLDGNLFVDQDTVGIIIENAFEQWWFTGADSSYFGDQALRVVFDGFEGSDRVRITVDPNALTTDDNFRTMDFSEWQDGDVVMYIKLLDTVNVHFAVYSTRNVTGYDESDEPLSNWGLDIYNTTDWQKIYVDPTNLEGNLHSLSGFTQFAFRSREYASNLIADEMYMAYNFNEFGLYADSSEFNQLGSLGIEPSIVDGATIETVPDGLFGDALHVQFAGGSGDRVVFGNPGTPSSYPEWNYELSNLVFYIKLNQPIDVNIEYSALRNGESINASDEPLSQHGLDINNTEDWQRIVLDLAEGMEGDQFDFTQFESFALRSRENTSDFLVDEVHVRYPGTVTSVEEDELIDKSFSLEQNYPNPFNPTTTIRYNLKNPGQTTLRVYNVLGQEVFELVNQEMAAGVHEVNFDASNLSSGIYLYKLESGNHMLIKKMILMK